MVNCGKLAALLRKPQVFVNRHPSGAIIATIVNWRMLGYGEFTFRLGEIGVVRAPTDIWTATDMWTGEVVATIT